MIYKIFRINLKNAKSLNKNRMCPQRLLAHGFTKQGIEVSIFFLLRQQSPFDGIFKYQNGTRQISEFKKNLNQIKKFNIFLLTFLFSFI